MHGLLQEPPEEHLSLSILSFQNVYDGICKGVRKGGVGVKTPLELDILRKLYYLRKRDLRILFAC